MASHLSRPSHGIRASDSIVSELEGTLLISKSLFPYFLLVALEAGGPVRAVVLLFFYPLLSLLRLVSNDDLALPAMIFLSTAGLRADDMKTVANATLPRFFLEDLRESAYRVFSRSGGKKYVVTRLPRALAEPFLREYLDVDHVVGTELRMLGRRCLGMVAAPGVMTGARSYRALCTARGNDRCINVGLCSGIRDQPFLLLCQERHVVSPEEKPSAVARSDYPRPLIFHDGRLVGRPGSLDFLAILLWTPLGALLAASRILIGVLLPYELVRLCCAVTGFRIRAGFPETPAITAGAPKQMGTLYACNHQTLLDPVILSMVTGRKVSAVTYSLSCFSELISPIPTIRLTRDRTKDRAIMQSLLNRGDLVVCPEGTTCREPYLLRFSPLFAEIAARIMPVAVQAKGTMFYGSTVRGYKWLDSFFFLMNPVPWYQLEFLAPVSGEIDGKSSYDVANHIQWSIGQAIGFECTDLTRKDKYRMLAGHDGVDSRSQ